VGYLMGPGAILRQILKIQQHTATCASAPGQWAALAALEGPQEEVEKQLASYGELRRLLVPLDGAGPLRLRLPEGTFYAMLDIRGTGLPSEAAARRFLDRAAVAMVPGSAYGPGGEGYLRLSFAVPETVLKEAVNHLVQEVTNTHG
jgi:aspartate aminotransferase